MSEPGAPADGDTVDDLADGSGRWLVDTASGSVLALDCDARTLELFRPPGARAIGAIVPERYVRLVQCRVGEPLTVEFPSGTDLGLLRTSPLTRITRVPGRPRSAPADRSENVELVIEVTAAPVAGVDPGLREGVFRVTTTGSVHILNLDGRTVTQFERTDEPLTPAGARFVMRGASAPVSLIRLLRCEQGDVGAWFVDERGDGRPTLRRTSSRIDQIDPITVRATP